MVVRAWIDEAVELLTLMPYTCALDIAEQGGVRSHEDVGWFLGVTRQQVTADLHRALRKLSARNVEEGHT